jgi:hypothetical protein
MNQDPSTSSISSRADADAVSRRAYELWEKEGRPEGCDLRHWLQAEQECRGAESSEDARRERGTNIEGTSTNTPGSDSDIRPLQGTRAAAAAKRQTNSPFPGERNPVGNGQTSTPGRRRSASSPAL